MILNLGPYRRNKRPSGQVYQKQWNNGDDMAFYYGDGSIQGATNVGAYNDGSTRYGQVLWFTTDAYGGTGFTFDWNPRAFTGNESTVYCRISKTGKGSNGKWPGCTNTSSDLSYTRTDKGYRFSDDNFKFEPNTTYYVYINRNSYDYGFYSYAQGSNPTNWGSSTITIY